MKIRCIIDGYISYFLLNIKCQKALTDQMLAFYILYNSTIKLYAFVYINNI